jgi:lipid-A-disaccharide synthase-like uncharacterized protein
MSHAVGAYLTDVFVTRLDWWVLLGFAAQALFTMRFLVQWIASERAGHSVIPVAFWMFSIRSSSPGRHLEFSFIYAIFIL